MPQAIDNLPLYSELPLFPGTDEHHAWEIFGENDDLGTVNWLTPERVLEAMKLVRRGVSFSLDLPLNLPARPTEGEGRTQYVHHVRRYRRGSDDHLDNFYLQGSSQWDGLRHIRYREFGWYQGLQEETLGDRIGIDAWGRHGISGRAVLLDLPRFLGDRLNVQDRTPMDGKLLEAIAASQGVSLKPADILLLRTGWMAWYLEGERSENPDPARMVSTAPCPGLDGTQATAAWIWDHRIAAIAADNIAVEATPVLDRSFQHRRLIAMFGMPLGELWTFEELAADCANDGIYEFFLVTKPLTLPQGVGSPPNAIAFK